jgi:hypothetical protein
MIKRKNSSPVVGDIEMPHPTVAETIGDGLEGGAA